MTESRVDLGCVGFGESEVWADHALGLDESGVFVDLGEDGRKGECPGLRPIIPDFICKR